MNSETTIRRVILVVTFLFSLLTSSRAFSQSLSADSITAALKQGFPPVRVAILVTQRGVDFELTKDIEAKLKGAGADDQLIKAVRDASRRIAETRKLQRELEDAKKEAAKELTKAKQDIQKEIEIEKKKALAEAKKEIEVARVQALKQAKEDAQKEVVKAKEEARKDALKSVEKEIEKEVQKAKEEARKDALKNVQKEIEKEIASAKAQAKKEAEKEIEKEREKIGAQALKEAQKDIEKEALPKEVQKVGVQTSIEELARKNLEMETERNRPPAPSPRPPGPTKPEGPTGGVGDRPEPKELALLLKELELEKESVEETRKVMEETLKDIDQAIETDPNNSANWTLYHTRGNVLLALRRCDEARGSFDRALAINPKYLPIRQAKEGALKECGRTRTASFLKPNPALSQKSRKTKARANV